MLKGHERAITYLAFNADGDLLVSAAREPTIVLWSATTGERLGTYEGHVGAVQHVDLSRELGPKPRGPRLLSPAVHALHHVVAGQFDPLPSFAPAAALFAVSRRGGDIERRSPSAS